MPPVLSLQPDFFPCPICLAPLDVRQSKKKKPYVICDSCGVQMFVRSKAGVRTFERMVGDAGERNVWKRLEDLEARYRLKCPECEKSFWIVPDQLKTSWLDGKFQGYQCPERGCDGVVEWKKENT